MDISLGLFLFIYINRAKVNESESKTDRVKGKTGGQTGSLDHFTVLNAGG